MFCSPATLFLSIFWCSVLLWACSNGQTRPPENSDQSGNRGNAVPVTIATAAQKDIPLKLRIIGNVEAYSTVEIKPQVEGKLARAYFKEGNDVKEGDLLFTIDPRPFEAELRQAQANLARDIAQMKEAESDVNRYRELFKKGIVSEREYEQSRTNLETLRSTVKASQAAVENAKLRLEYSYIRSPISGRLGRLMVNPGNIVEANQTTLVVINQIKPVYVTFSVPEQKLLEIRKHMASGGKLRVEAAIPTDLNNPVSGELTFLNNEVDSTTGTIMLKALFPNESELLWPGKFVNVALTITTLKDAVVIPSPAVQTGQDGEFVFVVKPDLTVESRPVVVGSRLDQDVVISEGLKPEEKVVTTGQLELVPGVKVEIKNSVEGSNQDNSGLTNRKGSI